MYINEVKPGLTLCKITFIHANFTSVHGIGNVILLSNLI